MCSAKETYICKVCDVCVCKVEYLHAHIVGVALVVRVCMNIRIPASMYVFG